MKNHIQFNIQFNIDTNPYVIGDVVTLYQNNVPTYALITNIVSSTEIECGLFLTKHSKVLTRSFKHYHIQNVTITFPEDTMRYKRLILEKLNISLTEYLSREYFIDLGAFNKQYYYIDDCGKVREDFCGNNDIVIYKNRWESGNFFYTFKSAIEVSDVYFNYFQTFLKTLKQHI